MATQLTTMPAAELRSLFHAALGEVRLIEAKQEEKEIAIRKIKDKDTWAILLIVFGAMGLILLVGIVLLVPGIILLKKNKAKTLATQQSFDEEITEFHQNATNLRVLPPRCRSSRALEYMIELLDYGRAFTWQECAKECERWLQNEVLIEQAEITAAEVKRAATAAENAAYYAQQTARNTEK